MLLSRSAMKFSIVTPSLNQAAFIEATIESVLSQQGDFELEYLVADGGSSDGTLAILDRYRDRLSYASGADGGQSDALNKAFARSTGDVLAWLNSDDVYLPGALARVAETLRATGCRWCFGQCRIIDERGRETRRLVTRYKNRACRSYSRARLLEDNFISQPATFFRRDLWLEAGALDPERWYSMDYDLWLRCARLAEPRFIPEDLASFRWHGTSKSGARFREGSWEAFQTACRSATLPERGAIVRHFIRYLARVTVYGALDLVAR